MKLEREARRHAKCADATRNSESLIEQEASEVRIAKPPISLNSANYDDVRVQILKLTHIKVSGVK